MATWDRMLIPLPFSRAIFLYGDAILISRDEDVEKARLRLETALNTLADNAEHNFDELWRRDEGRGMRDE